MNLDYKDCREWSDRMHKEVIVPVIYEKLGFQEADLIDEQMSKYEDLYCATDHHVETVTGTQVITQERIRTMSSAGTFNDFTIRYKPKNDPNNKNMEFFKMEEVVKTYPNCPYYMLYCVIDEYDRCVKYLLADIHELFRALRDKALQIPSSTDRPVRSQHGWVGVGINRQDNDTVFLTFNVVDMDNISKQGYHIIKKAEGFTRGYTETIHGTPLVSGPQKQCVSYNVPRKHTSVPTLKKTVLSRKG